MLSWDETSPDPGDRGKMETHPTDGSVAAPQGDRSDTPTGLRLPGRPSSVTYCANCRFFGPFQRRGPCPLCGWDPHTTVGRPHVVRQAVWTPTVRWWNPLTWFQGTWILMPIQTEIEGVRYQLDLETARLHRLERTLTEARGEVERLHARHRDLVIAAASTDTPS